MVIRDLTLASVVSPTSKPAPYIDRFFANVIDVLILLPVISLFNSGITNDLRWSLFNQNKSDSYLFIIQYGFISFALFLLYETLFIYFHKATPGHRFLYLRLVSEHDEPLTLFQIFFRTVFKFQAILIGCIPFIEVILRMDRTMFYDRLSQTKIVSLKPNRPDDIHPDFKKIINRWVHAAIFAFFIIVGLSFYQVVVRGSSAKKVTKTAPQCQDSLSQYLKSYLSKSKESDNLKCARQVVEKDLLKKSSNQAFIYLAQLVVSPNEDLKESYKLKYCEERTNKPICRSDWSNHYDNFKPDEEDIVNLLYQMDAALAKNDHLQVFGLLDLLYSHLDWNKNLELYYMTAYIFLTEQKSRSPAGAAVVDQTWNSKKSRFLKRMSISE